MSGFEKCCAINMGKGLAQTQTFFTPTFLWRWNSVYRNVSILSSRIQSHGTSNTNLQFRKIIFPLIFDKRVSIYRVFQGLVLISTQTSSDFFGRFWTFAAARVACRSLVSGFFLWSLSNWNSRFLLLPGHFCFLLIVIIFYRAFHNVLQDYKNSL